MKNLGTWLQIILCSFLLLLFVLTAVFTLPDFINGEGSPMAGSQITTTLFGFVMIIVLSFLGLRNGIKKTRKNKVSPALIPFHGTLDLHLSGKIEYKDYRNLILSITFKKPVYLIFMSILALFLLFFLTDYEAMIAQPFPIVLFSGIAILSPLLTLIQIKKLYKTNTLFQQKISYHLTNENLHIKSDTVDATQKWANFYKAKETKGFFMLYTGNVIATLLDKKMFRSNEIETFRSFIRSLPITKE